MGILRTDRVSGLGGANAIKGSVFFGGDGTSGTGKGTSLNIVDANDKADLNFAGNDFTFEAWVFPPAGVQWNTVYSQSWGLQIYIDTTSGDNFVKVYVGSNDTGSYAISGAASADGTIKPDAWNHIAFSRSGNSWTIFTNGTAATSSTSSQSLVSSDADYAIGIFNSIGSGNDAGSYFGFNGYISNLRIRTGAHYLPSTNFTPPVGELQKTSDTVLLACQSPGDITKEATGKTIVPTSKNLNDALPQASHFTPNSPVGFSTTTDVGTQFGSTFDGVTTFDSQAYMVPPGGNTRERNRGRGLWGGGWSSPSSTSTNNIDFIQIKSGGIAEDFGDLIAGGNQIRGVSSSTRGVFLGGRRPHPGVVNTMDFVTIATTANALDFGDLLTGRGAVGEISSQTRGIAAAGYNPGNTNTIEFITIATLGNSQDFGDTLGAGSAMAGTQSSTRGILAGNYAPSSPNTSNVIQFLTIATTGNTQDFGDLTDSRHSPSGTSNGVRAVFAAGTHLSPGSNNTMDFVTIASTGNAIDFGDLLTVSPGQLGATSDSIRGVFGGGNNDPLYHKVIQQVIISTTGNSVDIGDLTLARLQSGCVSDSHGGLS